MALNVLNLALRPAAGVVALGRGAVGTATRAATDASLATLDVLLSSRLASEAVDRVLASALARDAVTRTLESELADHAVTQVLESDLARDAVAQALASDLARAAVTQVLASDLARDAVSQALDSELAHDSVTQTLRSRLAQDALGDAFDGELPQLVAARIFSNERLLDTAVERLLASPALWQLVDEIAQSPAVMAAITAQSAGFADEVAGGLRARSRRADVWLEGAARKALRRPRTETP